MPIPNRVAKLDRSLAREQVYAQVRDWIVGGVLKPGEIVRDQGLAEQLGVSRTPVREALRRLEDEGLIETAKHRWTRVAPVNTEQAEDLYGVVKTLEVYALSLAHGRLGEADFAAMEMANTAMAEAVQRHDAFAAVQADNDFHQVWIGVAGNQELSRILKEVKAKIRRMEIMHFDSNDAAVSVAQHQEIMQALRKDQLGTALQALEENWEVDTDRFAHRSSVLKHGDEDSLRGKGGDYPAV